MRPLPKDRMNLLRRKSEDGLQLVLDAATIKMVNCEVNSKEWNDCMKDVSNIKALMGDKPKRIDPNTVILSATNLAGILLIINHERLNVITTKALGFILKAR